MSDTQLEVLFPQGKTLIIQGKELTIKPFKLGQLPKVFKTIEPIAGLFMNMTKEGTNPIVLFSNLISDGGDNIIDLIVIGSGESKEWVTELETEEGIDLLMAIVEVNYGFFTLKILPKLTMKLAQVNGQIS